MTPLTLQLLENAQCDPALLAGGVQITMSSRFAFNQDGGFAVWQGAFQQAGAHYILVQYTADASIRVTLGDAGPFNLPAMPSGGGVLVPFSITSTSGAISFTDREVAIGHLTRVEMFKVTAAA